MCNLIVFSDATSNGDASTSLHNRLQNLGSSTASSVTGINPPTGSMLLGPNDHGGPPQFHPMSLSANSTGSHRYNSLASNNQQQNNNYQNGESFLNVQCLSIFFTFLKVLLWDLINTQFDDLWYLL